MITKKKALQAKGLTSCGIETSIFPLIFPYKQTENFRVVNSLAFLLLQKLMAMATTKIMRRSIYIFFQNYHYFTSTVTLLLLPVSASILLSHVVESTTLSLQPTIPNRAQSIIYGAGLSRSNQFFSFLNDKLSRAIYSSVMTFPFTLSFLLVAKAAIFQTLHQNSPLPPTFSALLSHYKPLLITQLCSRFFVFLGTATGLWILFIAMISLDAFGFSSKFLVFLSAAGIFLYSIILSNTLVVCNIASVVAGTENCSGLLAILKACILIKGRVSTALTLALPANFSLFALEALFQHRVVRANCSFNKLSLPTAFEGLLIAYLYSLVILIDTILTCTFYKSYETGYWIDGNDNYSYSYRTEFMEEGTTGTSSNFRDLHELL